MNTHTAKNNHWRFTTKFSSFMQRRIVVIGCSYSTVSKVTCNSVSFVPLFYSSGAV